MSFAPGLQQDNIRKLYLKLKVIENNAYSSVLAAFRAQGDITWEKQRVLSILQRLLDVSPERHSAEMIRVETDPLVQSIVKDKINEKRLDIRALVEKNDYEARLQRIKNQYTLSQQMDTDSESEEFKKPPPSTAPKRGAPRGSRKKKTPQKRDYDEAFAPPASAGPGRPGRKPKKQKLLSPPTTATAPVPVPEVAATIPAPVPRHPVLDLIEEYKRQEQDFTNILDVQQLETIAEMEHKHMDDLEQKFNELKNNRDVGHPLGLEIQRKRDRLIKLVEKLEKAAFAESGL